MATQYRVQQRQSDAAGRSVRDDRPLQRDRLPRGARRIRRTGSTAQRAAGALLKPCRRCPARTSASPAACASRRSRVTGRSRASRPDGSPPHRAVLRGARRTVLDPSQMLVVGPRRGRLLAPTRCGWSPRRRRAAAGRLRPCAVRGRLLVQGRVPERLRLRARADLPARPPSAPAIDYLAQGLRQLPAADARPAGGDACPTGASATRPTWASRWSRCWRTPRDQLSYCQDAVATEAYLGTARSGVSVRRHARLLDYPMHDGRNARAWVHVEVDALGRRADRGWPANALRPHARPRVPDRARHRRDAVQTLLAGRRASRSRRCTPSRCWTAHNEIRFHTWGDDDLLPAARRDAARRCATDDANRLARLAGDVLLLRGASTAARPAWPPTPIRPSPRRASDRRRSRTRPRTPRVHRAAAGAPASADRPFVDIEWADATPCRSRCACRRTTRSAAYASRPVAVRARQHRAGRPRPQPGEPLAGLPRSAFRPTLTRGGVYRGRTARAGGSVPFDPTAPAAAGADLGPARHQPGGHAVPVADGGCVRPTTASVLAAACAICSRATRFATRVRRRDRERRHARRALRRRRARPARRIWRCSRCYRVGNGAAGNVGADALGAHRDTQGGIIAVDNPLPAVGGAEPESAQGSGCTAPQAFRRRSVRSPRPTTPRSPPATRTCSARSPRGAGPAAGTRCSSPSTGSAACRSTTRSAGRTGISRGYRMAGYDLEVEAPVLRPARHRASRLRRAGLFPLRRQGGVALGAERGHAARRHPRVLSSRQLHLRPAACS